MKQFTIEVSGKSRSDIENAIQEVLRLVSSGYGVGSNSNDDGDFSFSSDGEYEDDLPMNWEPDYNAPDKAERQHQQAKNKKLK